MRVKNIMTEKVITTDIGTTVLEAEKLLSLNGIGRLIVKDKDEIVGILTDGDLMFEHDLNSKIKDYITKDIITIQENATVQEAAEVLSDNHIGGLPVVNRSGELTGIVTAEDI